MSYQFSIWYVPANYQEFIKEYNLKHIPHVTYKTNIETLEECKQLIKELPLEIFIEFKNVIKFPQMYETDNLFSYGWLNTVDGIQLEHEPHTTIEYFDEYKKLHNHKIQEIINPPKTKCFLSISDTRSMDPSKWCIL
jgi:hypothetical protein